MFIFRHTGKRAPAYPANALYVSPEGVKQIGIPMGLLEEIAEPNPPADYTPEEYYRNEQEDAPYVVYTKKSAEQLEELRKSRIKQQIVALEEQITPRRLREAILTGDNAFIGNLSAQIEALRSTL